MSAELHDQPGPLEGLRVIDFGQYIAGPAAAMMLADLGAEVVRIDPPGGPMWNSPAMSSLNRGKKSICLDLKTSTDVQIALELIDSADVLIENFRPGVMTRLGLGAAFTRSRNPRLVYLSLPGFSSLDTRSDLPGWEGLILSATGGFTDMGLNRVLMGINPSYSPIPLASSYAAALGTTAVAVALLERERSGQGDSIEVPLADAVVEGLAYNSLRVEQLPDRYHSQREAEIERRRSAGADMDMSFEDLQELLDPFYRSYECADGRMFYNCCPAHRTHAIKALKVLDLWKDIKDEIPLFDPYLSRQDWPDDSDCTLLAYPLSAQWSTRLAASMKQAFLTRPSQEWERLFDEAGIPGAAHRTSQEWMYSEHARAAGLMVEVDDPQYERLLRPGPVIWAEGSRDQALRGAPAIDENRDEIMAMRGDGPRRPSIPTTYPRTLPLEGIRILDITNVIAGPTIGSTLARFGAGVTKIDPVTPTFDPYHSVVVGLQANRGKQSALVDLKTDRGQQVLARLIAESDIVTFNGSAAQMNRLGLNSERISAINPETVLIRVDAYGGPQLGPRSEIPGYDDNVQACTGIMTRFGGSAKTPEEHAHLGTIDALAGFYASAAAVFALLQQRRTGHHQTARVSLAAAGQLLQVPFMFDHPGRTPFDEPSGRDALGEHAMYRCYEASDGWLFFAGRQSDALSLKNIREFSTLRPGMSDAELGGHLAEILLTQPVAHWHKTLHGIGTIAVHRVEDVAALKTRHTVKESEGDIPLTASPTLFVRHDNHPIGKWVDLAAPNAIRFARSKVRMPSPAPRYGQHTSQVLASLGFSDHEMQLMFATKNAADRWSADGKYLPD